MLAQHADHAMRNRPEVIITSLCPGPVKTELARTTRQNSIFSNMVTPAFMAVVGKSPDYGARIYLTAALARPEEHVSNLVHSPSNVHLCFG